MDKRNILPRPLKGLLIITSVLFGIIFTLTVLIDMTMTPEELAASQAEREKALKELNKKKREPWELARIQVAANQVNKYSPYHCSVYYEEDSIVSAWDRHTVHLVCDNWERYEVKTVDGRVIVEKKG
ncbi:TPA: hypothetical protein ACGFXT_003363 [Vibrio cholerae]|uniref:hypothetical protein n=1 Tax=Vibrio cholerae TaxID=666 RepID=UPI00050BE299|nr:hypothetical protein [Vibrio cholerae]EGQ9171190.1 hypothetical protein [Vibrio cholerae]EGR1091236.1 hypothetical protein [Vibrio cholerae]EJL3955884.1 hypothetical protein [Vibrio cholerae]BCK29704.1 hypothetical protein VCSRO77_3119 [Vibrio cholerae]